MRLIVVHQRFLLLVMAGLVATGLMVVVVCDGSPGSVLHICNRGFCYTKKETPLSPSNWHLTQLAGRAGGTKRKKRQQRGIDYCTIDSSLEDLIDCELFSILGAERVDEEFEALECPKGLSCEPQDDIVAKHPSMMSQGLAEGEIIELDTKNDDNAKKRPSWKERPLSGKCYDNELDYEFDCNLIEIIE